jgi:hypothetical protein
MTEIIVYRTPLEAAIWHSFMDGGAIVWLVIMALGLLWAGTYVGYERLVRSYAMYRHQPVWKARPRWVPGPGWTATLVTVAAAIAIHLYNIS